MIRRALTWIAVLASIGGAVFIANAIAQATQSVKATSTNEWDPDQVDAVPEDVVSFEFDQATVPHNVVIRLPNDELPKNEGLDNITEDVEGCDGALGSCPPGHDPVTYEVPPEAEDGAILYICTLHATYSQSEDRWTGMVGTIGEDDDPDPRLGNPSPAPGPPWELGTEPPRMLGAKVKGIRRGVRMKLRVSHPGKANVRFKRGGKTVLKRNVKKLKQGANKRKVRSKRLGAGRYKLIIRYRDSWGLPGQPKVVKRTVKVRY